MSPNKCLQIVLIVSMLPFSKALLAHDGDSTHAKTSDTIQVQIFTDDPILLAMDNMWKDERLHWENFESDSICLNVYQFEAGFIPNYPDSVMAKRLEILNRNTPLDLDYNSYVKAFISLYTDRRRDITARVLGLAALYYPLFEEKLDQFDIPLELKHLAVVESALNPSARSRVGATGLWQFMYSTGRIYGLDVDSYIDERSDPYKSTIAACRYMKYLYGIYGDWNMVLAAYNSGPGNVNKAIRRSGGKRDYWSIRAHLPRETRSYVPAFIAVNYVMNYATEHNIYPLKPELTYSEIDTLHIFKKTNFEQIAFFTGAQTTHLELLNPSIRQGIFPENPLGNTLYLPSDLVGLYLANEDSLMKIVPKSADVEIAHVETTYYTVRRGDALGMIAQRNGVGLSQLRQWNNIHGNKIYPGQKLKIEKEVTQRSSEDNTASKPELKEESTAVNSKKLPPNNIHYDKYYTVQSGDTLWDIAKAHPGITVNDIKAVNHNLSSRLKPGQKIKIPTS